MSAHKLVSMQRTKKDKKSHNSHAETSIGQEKFPFGLTISLDDESLAKLGIKKLPKVGTLMVVAGVGRVESISERSDERRKHRNVSIQLEKLEVGPMDKPTAEDAVSEAIKDV